MDYKKALHKASSLCSRQEYCRSDIQKKLEKWDLSDSDTEKIIQKLVEEKFIDEERFTSFYVRDKFRFNKWGRRKIMWQLKQKGIDRETINLALDQIDPDEYNEKLQEVIREKIRQVKNKEPLKQKAAVIRNAVSKGYEYEEIMPLVEQLLLKK
ncbi:regulatory protein RecX [Marinilabilia salmonicolor]|jgi:regulatory protein|uniref:Regulatory protein RecX n=1 Tax=Marinilabilia salmonicolor TaxID=989 RepID=A0A2T0XSX8_9BACT|nr:regulatory protein RecX [Marinilabilia salmonicolor]PRZ02027.1 regulatory protein [Marinilabilia salmonicolor]RCW39462.1 regulatory protein [Marinilabilia salmonicolor]